MHRYARRHAPPLVHPFARTASTRAPRNLAQWNAARSWAGREDKHSGTQRQVDSLLLSGETMENGDEASVTKGGGRLRRLVVHSLGAPPALAAVRPCGTHACLRGRVRVCVRRGSTGARWRTHLHNCHFAASIPDIRQFLSDLSAICFFLFSTYLFGASRSKGVSGSFRWIPVRFPRYRFATINVCYCSCNSHPRFPEATRIQDGITRAIQLLCLSELCYLVQRDLPAIVCHT